MDNRAIGIFDSGLGGLPAMKALQELLPEENIIYFGDTGRLPYGAKTREQLRRMAVQDLDLIAAGGEASGTNCDSCGIYCESNGSVTVGEGAAVPASLGDRAVGIDADMAKSIADIARRVSICPRPRDTAARCASARKRAQSAHSLC